MSKWTENSRRPQAYLFSGKIFCADCQVPMMPSSEKKQGKNANGERTNRYSCKTYHISGRQKCTRHGVNENVLRKIVLDNIQAHAAAINLDEERMTAELRKRLIGDLSADKAETQKELGRLKHELHNLDVTLEQLYEDKITGTITAETFATLAAKTEAKRNEVSERVMLLEQGTKETKARMGDIQSWIRLVKENATVTDIDRSLLDTLVERVEIDKSKIENGVKVQDVRIIYKFVGLV